MKDTQIFTRDGAYLMLAFDHRGSFVKMMRPEDAGIVTDEEAIEMKKRIIAPLAEYCSGILIDPVYGLPALRKAVPADTLPFLLPLEETGYEGGAENRRSKLTYSAREIKEMGAQGAKLLLYFNANTDASTQTHQVRITQEALKDAHSQDFPFFLEIVTYGEGENSASAILRSVEILKENGIEPDVWKLEFPSDEDGCGKVSKLIGETPWILLTRGVKFEVFKEQLKVAAKEGCKGFLAGRGLWQEALELKGEEQEYFLAETMPERFEQLIKIMNSL